MEIYVMLRGFDEIFSNYVQQRTSYTFNEILFSRRFTPMYRESSDGKTTILELHKLNIHAPVEMVTSLPVKMIKFVWRA